MRQSGCPYDKEYDHTAKKNYLLCLFLLILGLLGLGMAGCGASSLSPIASSATPTGTSVFGVWPSESRRASPIHPVQVTPTPTHQPADVPVEIQETPLCAPVPTPLPGPITWQRIHSDWYQYSFEVPSGWYEGETASPDRRNFSSVPPLSGPFPYYCPSPYGWMKLDFAVHPLQYQPDLTGMSPTTIAGRPAWVSVGEGGEETSFAEFSAYISGPQYWYHLWFGCAPGEGENEVREAFVAQCTDVMEHILGTRV